MPLLLSYVEANCKGFSLFLLGFEELTQNQKHIPSPWQDRKAKGERPKQHWPTEKQWTVSDPPLYKIQWGSRKIKLYIWLRVTKAWYGSPIIFLGISKFIISIECIMTIAKIVVINNWEEMLINFEVPETLQLHHNLEEKYAITISFKKLFLKISTIKVSFWFLNLSFEWSINVTNQTLFLIVLAKFNHMI